MTHFLENIIADPNDPTTKPQLIWSHTQWATPD